MSPTARPPRVLAFATQGAGGNDEHRIRTLLERFAPQVHPFDRRDKPRSLLALLGRIRRERPDLVVMEGSGLAGGLAVLAASLLWRTPYVVSSGDAVGPFIAAHHPLLGLAGHLYERALYRCAAGFIGWTPYLVGRALTFGAPRAVTAPGWAPYARRDTELAELRAQVRRELGLGDALVVGLAGALVWNGRVGSCYGLELVRAAQRLSRRDVVVLLVGDGTGREHLEREAARVRGARVVLTGRVPQDRVPAYLAAMDLASLPQSTDGVGSFRYTTKLSEYLACGLPVVTGQIPLAYDLDEGWSWRLPGDAPWEARYVDALASLLERLTPGQLAEKRARVPRASEVFDVERQTARVTRFVADLLQAAAPAAGDAPAAESSAPLSRAS